MKGFQLIDSQSNELLPIIDLEQYNLNEKSRFLPILYNELLRMSESLKIIDIEKYDSGEKYSFCLLILMQVGYYVIFLETSRIQPVAL